jgi:hypothetical protein
MARKKMKTRLLIIILVSVVMIPAFSETNEMQNTIIENASLISSVKAFQDRYTDAITSIDNKTGMISYQKEVPTERPDVDSNPHVLLEVLIKNGTLQYIKLDCWDGNKSHVAVGNGNVEIFLDANVCEQAISELNGISEETNIRPPRGDMPSRDDSSNYVILEFKSLSPLKQFKTGLASADVFCKGNLTGVIKSSTGSPACVKPEHVERLLANGWFFVPLSDRAIRPLVTVIDNKENLGIELTEMKTISKQDYDTPHENNLKVSTFQGNLSGVPTVVSNITNVSNQKITLNQVLITGSIITSPDSTMTPMYADVIGCSISHIENGVVTCPYPTAMYEPVELEPDEYFVSYFSDDFAHKFGPINKITTSIWYDLGSADSPHHRTEIDSLLELDNEN